ncbi:glucuronate isomerase [Oscillospiraceae bacterium 42-9]
MKPFLDGNFLLDTPAAQELYHQTAAQMPILDYHCHIDPQEIYQDRQFETITQVWLGGDHYKWRQMRSNGVEEAYITGDAPDREKFQKWAETLDRAIGNPLFHWSHLELRRFFGYTGVLGAETAQEVWELCNQKLREPDMSVRNLILRSHVTLLCTTDDPADDLKWHRLLKEDRSFPVQVLPAWRPDKAMGLEKPGYLDYLAQLGEAAGRKIASFEDWKAALRTRMDYFAALGCRLSDHGLEYLMYAPATEEEAGAIFAKRLNGQTVSREEELRFKTACLLFLGGEYAQRGWAMQLHFGVIRDNNSAMFQQVGPDTGFDAMGPCAPAGQALGLLNALSSRNALPKTILYSLNPGDDPVIGAMIGCFQDAPAVGKVQQGAAWWFNDHKEGMRRQMTSLANLGLLGNFLGMLTDSRSFLSYPRHEYFRRVFCGLIGGWVENGEYPYNPAKLTRLVKDVCYNNAVRYFGFPLEEA